ncbi:hypothetical protein A1O3_05299 [Capronia epimyces CBS 606.96]|uniref:ATPase synthesis protein 25 n=1 Tax=Capronia epimyces CBS 606.96 TaxID=1182542 RepID=W9YQT0_9EURO|nr:uncharacterized protein A1O3_05299 [Capronia epimyces CBS 606.96]EXJ84629.1 hypothetical protein A1O3_05299 [Capronia epimyces CBS 606.96]
MHPSPLARCTACRVSVLEAFTSLVAGVSIPAARGVTARQRLPLSSSPAPCKPHLVQGQGSGSGSLSTRPFSSLAARPQESAQTQAQSSIEFSTESSASASAQDPSPSLSEPASADASDPSPSASSEPPSADASAPIPWYLQVEEPAPPAPVSPLLTLQEIPPLPLDPPAILQPILEHLSVQIGLDNLVLLDLRHLDPPPALGANLIMVIGTARSVKHLNVSADRFCRWVRKEYKLRPYADGLLGRNELKLKLRRKARKLKLAQSVGNTMVAKDADDGITTGWICVNVGAVDQAVLPDQIGQGEDAAVAVVDQDLSSVEVQREAEAEAEAEGDEEEADEKEEDDQEEEYQNPSDSEYVGFGSRPNSPRIVVQMFTEEKRIEMDLEGLWHARNTRHARRHQRADAEAHQRVHAEADSVRGRIMDEQ